MYFLHGFDVMVGALGGMFSVWIFGTAYYGDAFGLADRR